MITKLLDRAPQTIHSEVKDGTVRQIRRQVQNSKTYEYESFFYSADAGQAAYEAARANSRKQPKWIASPNVMAYADHQMKKEKQSPDVVVGRAKKLGLFPNETVSCTTTLYNYIDFGLMETKTIDLHLKVRWKTNKTKSRRNKKILGDLIEKSPDIVDTRERFGDWEIDTVNGLRMDKDYALLTLTERKTRYEVLFKTITSDNGAEFAGLSTLLKDNTEVFFHPSLFFMGTRN